MAKSKVRESLRRGKSDTRSHFERARDNFETVKGDTRETRRTSPCPTCDAPMTCIRRYRGKDAYRFEGICSANAKHNIERFGYFTTEGED